MPAAGLEGEQAMTERLAEDQARARRRSDGINGLAPALSATVPQTNIVQVQPAGTGMTHAEWVAALQALGLERQRCAGHRVKRARAQHRGHAGMRGDPRGSKQDVVGAGQQ
ncbi:hypothetical protein G6F45_014120 [Rhizopus arrhizus]|nr:hypothetical protein G6F45_014120 [Rhizopus arrhizus]